MGAVGQSRHVWRKVIDRKIELRCVATLLSFSSVIDFTEINFSFYSFLFFCLLLKCGCWNVNKWKLWLNRWWKREMFFSFFICHPCFVPALRLLRNNWRKKGKRNNNPSFLSLPQRFRFGVIRCYYSNEIVRQMNEIWIGPIGENVKDMKKEKQKRKLEAKKCFTKYL